MQYRKYLLSLAILRLSVLNNLFLNALVHTVLKLASIAQLEEDLKPDEHGSKEDGLDEIVQESGGAPLEFAVSDKLRNPADDVKNESTPESSIRVVLMQIVAIGRAAHAESGEQESGNGLQEDVEHCVEGGGNGSEVEFKIWDGQP